MHDNSILIMIVGAIIIASGLLRHYLTRLGLPALISYIAIGICLREIDLEFKILSSAGYHTLSFMADIGMIALLFKVGLDSNIKALLAKLPQALLIWICNVIFVAISGFILCHLILNLALIPSLFVATALTATSLGIVVNLWDEAKHLNTPEGQLLIDVGELDDISAIFFMAILITIAPLLASQKENLWVMISFASFIFILKFILFALFCYFLAHYCEKIFSQFMKYRLPETGQMLGIIGVSFIIAAIAEWLGFSYAIGALFAGLVFSRDPVAVKSETNFSNLYEFFIPFFFIGICIKIDFHFNHDILIIGSLLLITGILSKFVGTYIPALLFNTKQQATLLSLSMVPRAEIAILVMYQGKLMGDAFVSEDLYFGMILVVLGTCILIPLILKPMLLRHSTLN